MSTTASGVDYKTIDPLTRLGLELGRQTASANTSHFGAKSLEEFRGASAYAAELPGGDHIGSIIECLGTKSRIAEWLLRRTGNNSGFHAIGMDTLRMATNDLITIGIPPLIAQIYFSVGSGEFLKGEDRATQILRGFADACMEDGAVYAGGETPVLANIIGANETDLACNTVGYLGSWLKPIKEQILAGDKILGLASSGLHSNGSTKVFKVGTENISESRTIEFFKLALKPTIGYTKACRVLIEAGIQPSYAVNVTGHGWLKLMRAKAEVTYNLHNVTPPVPDFFEHLKHYGELTLPDMYRAFNMGLGFVYILRDRNLDRAQELLDSAGYTSYFMGTVEEGPRRVLFPKSMGLEALDGSEYSVV